MELLDLKLAIDQSQIQSRMHESKGNIAALQAELKETGIVDVAIQGQTG